MSPTQLDTLVWNLPQPGAPLPNCGMGMVGSVHSEGVCGSVNSERQLTAAGL